MESNKVLIYKFELNVDVIRWHGISTCRDHNDEPIIFPISRTCDLQFVLPVVVNPEQLGNFGAFLEQRLSAKLKRAIHFFAVTNMTNIAPNAQLADVFFGRAADVCIRGPLCFFQMNAGRGSGSGNDGDATTTGLMNSWSAVNGIYQSLKKVALNYSHLYAIPSTFSFELMCAYAFFFKNTTQTKPRPEFAQLNTSFSVIYRHCAQIDYIYEQQAQQQQAQQQQNEGQQQQKEERQQQKEEQQQKVQQQIQQQQKGQQRQQQKRLARIGLSRFFLPIGWYQLYASGELLLVREATKEDFQVFIPQIAMDIETIARDMHSVPQCIRPQQTEAISEIGLACRRFDADNGPRFFTKILTLEDPGGRYSRDFQQFSHDYATKYNSVYDFTEITTYANQYDLLCGFVDLITHGEMVRALMADEEERYHELCRTTNMRIGGGSSSSSSSSSSESNDVTIDYSQYPHICTGYYFIDYDKPVILNAMIVEVRERWLNELIKRQQQQQRLYDGDFSHLDGYGSGSVALSSSSSMLSSLASYNCPLLSALKQVTVVPISNKHTNGILIKFHPNTIVIDMLAFGLGNQLISMEASSLSKVTKTFLPNSPYKKLNMDPVLNRIPYLLARFLTQQRFAGLEDFFRIDDGNALPYTSSSLTTAPASSNQRYINYSAINGRMVSIPFEARPDYITPEQWSRMWCALTKDRLMLKKTLQFPSREFFINYLKMDCFSMFELMDHFNTITTHLQFCSMFALPLERCAITGNSTREPNFVLMHKANNGCFDSMCVDEMKILIPARQFLTADVEDIVKQARNLYYYPAAVAKKFDVYTSDGSKIKIDGALNYVQSEWRIHSPVISVDFQSFYPNTICANNLSKQTTMIAYVWQLRLAFSLNLDANEIQHVHRLWNENLQSKRWQFFIFDKIVDASIDVLMSPFYHGPVWGQSIFSVEHLFSLAADTRILIVWAASTIDYDRRATSDLLSRRQEIKRRMKQITDPAELSILEAKQIVLKLTANSGYGIKIAEYSSSYAIMTGAAITFFCRVGAHLTAPLLEIQYYLFMREQYPNWNGCFHGTQQPIDFEALHRRLDMIRHSRNPAAATRIKYDHYSAAELEAFEQQWCRHSNIVFIDTDGLKMRNPFGISDKGIDEIVKRVGLVLNEIYQSNYIKLETEASCSHLLVTKRKTYAYFIHSPIDRCVAHDFRLPNTKIVKKGFEKNAIPEIKAIFDYILRLVHYSQFHLNNDDGHLNNNGVNNGGSLNPGVKSHLNNGGDGGGSLNSGVRSSINVAHFFIDVFKYMYAMNPSVWRRNIPANRHKNGATTLARFINANREPFSKYIEAMRVDYPPAQPCIITDPADPTIPLKRDHFLTFNQWRVRPCEINFAKILSTYFANCYQFLMFIFGEIQLCHNTNNNNNNNSNSNSNSSSNNSNSNSGSSGNCRPTRACAYCQKARKTSAQYLLIYLYSFFRSLMHPQRPEYRPRPFATYFPNKVSHEFAIAFFQRFPISDYQTLVNGPKGITITCDPLKFEDEVAATITTATTTTTNTATTNTAASLTRPLKLRVLFDIRNCNAPK